MNPKCNLPEEERAEIFGLFDGALTQDEEDAVRRMFPQYLFFRNEYEDDGFHVSSEPVRICTCTACRQSFTAVRGNYARGRLHGESCNCPECGAVLEGKAVGKYRYHMPSLERWIKTAIARPAPDGGLLIEAGDCRRRFTHDGLTGEIDWFPKARYYFRKGTIMMWEERVLAWACGARERELGWQPCGTVHDPFQPKMMGSVDYYGDYSVIFLGDALAASGLKYCRIEDFYHYQYAADLGEGETARWIAKYLAWYALYPQIEFAVRFGLGEAVHELITDGKKNARLLDWKAATPAGFLRMNKADARIFLKAEMELADLKAWRETAAALSFGGYIDLVDLVGGTGNLRETVACAKTAGLGLERAARYIARLVPKCRQYAPPTAQIIRTWKDYLDMARRLNYDLTEETVVMPKDLQQRHDTAAELLNELGRLDEMKRYKARRKRLEKRFGFALGGLRVVIPASAEEIVLEGRTLKHCVGGYAARHIDGKTTILFLRKQRTPGRSFLTIELYEDRGQVKIRQIHGYRNEHYGKRAAAPREKYAWFLDEWLAWVNAGSRRDNDGQAILPDKNEEARTA